MDTLRKVLHPNAETQAALGDHHESPPIHNPQPRAAHHHPRQPEGATGLSPNHKQRSDFVGEQQQQQQEQQPRAGHHHPRQPVGATGLPPNHKPQSDSVGVTGIEAGLEGGDVHQIGKVAAESGNNFPGTNPHPTHSALGNQDAKGVQGTLNPSRE